MSVYTSRENSRVVIIDEELIAFRDDDGDWSTKCPGFTFADLADEFRTVTDDAEASKLRSKAITALSL